MLLLSSLTIIYCALFAESQSLHRVHQHDFDHPRPEHATSEDKFHLSRIERVRYGKKFRPPFALPLTAETSGAEDCKYKKEPWQECDPISRTQKRRLVLKKVNPSCPSTKETERPCKAKAAAGTTPKPKSVGCRYKKGVWSECDAQTGLKTRTDLLKISRNAETSEAEKVDCEPTRTMTRKCKSTRVGCRYNRSAAWSECNPRTNLRTKVLKLESGSKSSPECSAERQITKTCRGSEKTKKRQKQDSSFQEEIEEE